jgi:2-keto-4-pentenoate hydratase/2-oxohepta-3-ene-1,7-dioic acid hydratase in catechol pathway
MRLLHFKDKTGYRLGVQTSKGVCDIAQAASALKASNIPTTLEAVFSQGTSELAELIETTAMKQANAPWMRDQSQLSFGPCVLNPNKILCIGLNYRRHAAETGQPIPEIPIVFSKFRNTLAASGDRIPLPPTAVQYDYEAELVVVIGKKCKYVPEDKALEVVFGYCNGNDVSARDLQLRTSQWLLGKTPDRFFPTGPYLVTADEVGDPHALKMRCWVNDECRQDSNTGDMIFKVPRLVSYISQYMTLEPGDVISTGTPSGVIIGMQSKVWLKSGDEVSVEIEKLGRLTNTLQADTGG